MALELNRIGLGQEKAYQTAEKLNKLLADYQIFYMNVRGLHWNIRGPEFFMLHEKFEELYKDVSEKIDAIAERILMLGFTPRHSFSSYAEITDLREVENVTDGQKAIQSILHGLRALLIQQRDILNFTDETDDEGTNTLMSDYISEQEGLVWMYSAALG